MIGDVLRLWQGEPQTGVRVREIPFTPQRVEPAFSAVPDWSGFFAAGRARRDTTLLELYHGLTGRATRFSLGVDDAVGWSTSSHRHRCER
jgi:hypothetical protein